jgi:ATP-dependent exoDNAse (exonuclease V) alpha subunit
MIEGQAGTGKSTTLTAIARAHEADGRQLIVTSTAALAAQRLANELTGAGVTPAAYSTQALHAAVVSGRLVLDGRTTVIHDEAALASTKEQHRLFAAIQASGARLIEVGDPRQSQAVGAGGLWPYLEQAARNNQARVELTRNVRAHDPADRRDQQLFRDGEHEQALRDYHARGRVAITGDQHQVEDGALEAAHADRQTGHHTLVIAQTSNDHLDELNARAQALRIEDGEIGQRGVPVTGRPYELHAGDQIQIRRTINHPSAGRLTNGTTGHVLEIDPERALVRLRLADASEPELDRDQIDRADLRLSYVQHPFPAQGQTTDTTHLIVSEHATEEGCYVALTRARERTTIHASLDQRQPDGAEDRLRTLAERMSRTEPEIPSIRTPLAHEQHIRDHPERAVGATADAPAIGLAERNDEVDRSMQSAHEILAKEAPTAPSGAQDLDGAPSLRAWGQKPAAIERHRDEVERGNGWEP